MDKVMELATKAHDAWDNYAKGEDYDIGALDHGMCLLAVHFFELKNNKKADENLRTKLDELCPYCPLKGFWEAQSYGAISTCCDSYYIKDDHREYSALQIEFNQSDDPDRKRKIARYISIGIMLFMDKYLATRAEMTRLFLEPTDTISERYIQEAPQEEMEPTGVVERRSCQVQTKECEAKIEGPVTYVWGPLPSRMQTAVCGACLREKGRTGEWYVAGAKVDGKILVKRKPEGLMIHGHAFPAEPKSDAPDEKDRYEENVIFGAAQTIDNMIKGKMPVDLVERFKLDSWQDKLMFLVKPISMWYAVEPDDVLRHWIKHYIHTYIKEGEKYE